MISEQHEHHLPYDPEGSRLGMWLFLFSELLLFGGLFILYASYLTKYTADFVIAGKELSRTIGAINTIILLVSSYFVAASITAIRRNAPRIAMLYVGSAITLGLVFLINKYFEWGHKFHLGIYPRGPALEDRTNGEVIFYGLYYCVTGLHGLHVIIGGTLLAFALYYIYRKKITAERFVFLENAGLYWHLVDLIWIFVFPLFYLVV
ncbi:MAG: cytochrome c oxidase subunit 3 [Oligoflexia bacterium]|nr:cytochrome c oxidase subunit 3 [Oligoflexia bacterium]MBF0367037.1 cytochrome c oxidase subunit 3 [Oligoflexia bacterium]